MIMLLHYRIGQHTRLKVRMLQFIEKMVIVLQVQDMLSYNLDMFQYLNVQKNVSNTLNAKKSNYSTLSGKIIAIC